MNRQTFIQGLMDFIDKSPTAFHAVSYIEQKLIANGFIILDEGESWNVENGKGYYVIRNGSSIIAFNAGKSSEEPQGYRMAGAHTDSPSLKIKPDPVMSNSGYIQLGVEVYGGALLNPWFDRDLSIAGRVSYLDDKDIVRSCLVNFERPLAFIASLAIHFDRDANKNRSINAQKDLPPVIMNTPEEKLSFTEMIASQIQREHPDLPVKTVLDSELFLYDVQSSSLLGIKDEFIAGARLDNLLSCYTGMQALLHASGDFPCLLVFNDHEEVGSLSSTGAQGPFLKSVLQRLFSDSETFHRVINGSMFISMDNAHGVHPNYADKYDTNHGPVLNSGPVIKVNANQRYITSSETASIIRSIALKSGIPLQTFVMRSDLACGSTIGPITSAEIGVRAVDMGVPTFAMHSIRELAGVEDPFSLFLLIKGFYNSNGFK